MLRSIIVASLLMTSVPVWADTFNARNRTVAADLGGGVFETWSRGTASPRKYWCAAGDFAFALGVSTRARIYLVTPPQPGVTDPRKRAVRFTLTPEAAGIKPVEPQLTLGVSVIGDNMSVLMAREQCARIVSRP